MIAPINNGCNPRSTLHVEQSGEKVNDIYVLYKVLYAICANFLVKSLQNVHLELSLPGQFGIHCFDSAIRGYNFYINIKKSSSKRSTQRLKSESVMLIKNSSKPSLMCIVVVYYIILFY